MNNPKNNLRNNITSIQWDEEEREIRLRCSCGSETLSITGYLDSDIDEILYLSIQDRVKKGKPSYRQRLSQIWKILRTGDPYEDQMVIALEDVEGLIHELQDLVDTITGRMVPTDRSAIQ